MKAFREDRKSMKSSDLMEIERKWIVKGLPDADLPLIKEQYMRQGYISVEPTVRIRLEQEKGKDAQYIICFKSKGKIARKEIEFPIEEAQFGQLEELIGCPLIEKTRYTYELGGGLELEVNSVEPETDTGYWYAEVEFPDIETAKNWTPPSYLAEYLSCEVTEKGGYSMGSYWIRTRKKHTDAVL